MRLSLALLMLAHFRWFVTCDIDPNDCDKILKLGPRNTFIPEEICAKKDYFYFYLDSIIPKNAEDFKLMRSFWSVNATKIMANILVDQVKLFHQYLMETDSSGFVYRSIAELVTRIPTHLSRLNIQNAYLSVYMDTFSFKQLYSKLLNEKELAIKTCETLLAIDLIEGDLIKQYWIKGYPCHLMLNGNSKRSPRREITYMGSYGYNYGYPLGKLLAETTLIDQSNSGGTMRSLFHTGLLLYLTRKQIDALFSEEFSISSSAIDLSILLSPVPDHLQLMQQYVFRSIRMAKIEESV
ncbi:hypothetical protein Ciccas_008268 [Cichlidogyrus casuarinus]|uniref:Uncharacterized protein n=1 Tax=Cichlidogyrus casuarinus TaxID=1844966 RepID=A0ABD2Q1P0_9PLAT